MQKALLLCLLCGAATRPALAQATDPLPPRPPQLPAALPDSVALVQLPRLRQLSCDNPAIVTHGENVFFPYTTLQPILSRAAGVQVTPHAGAPGDWATVRVRGSSLSGSDQPLYLLDGLPALNSDFAPGQLAQIPPPLGGTQVLVSAAAPNPLLFVPPQDIERVEVLKGALATTRYGSQGANGVVNIVTRRGGSAQAPTAPRLHYDAQLGVQQVRQPLALLDARQYAELANEVWRNDGSRGNPPFDAARLAGLGAGTDWQREVFGAALLHSHQLSLGGSTARTRYLASLGYLGQEGVVLNSQLRRYTGRLHLDRALSPTVRVWLSAAGAVVTRTLPPAATVPTALRAAPTVAATGPDGAPTLTSQGSPVPQPGYAASFPNPLTLATRTATTDDTRRLLVQAGLSWQLHPALRLETRLSDELATTEATNRALLPAANFTDPPTPSEVQFTTERLHTVNAQASLLLEQPGGAERRHALTAEATVQAQHFGRRQELTYPQLIGPFGSSSYAAEYPVLLLSALATARYTFAGRLSATALLRADRVADARAGLGDRDRDVQLYPGLEARWEVSQESFLRDSRVLSSLWLTAGLGQCSNYALLATALTTTSGLQYRPATTSLATTPTPRTTQLNVGVQAGLLHGRLQVQATYYRHATAHARVGQLLTYFSPGGNPANVLTARDIALRNQGVELAASYALPVGSGQVALTTRLAAARNQLTVVQVDGTLPLPGLAAGDDGYHPFFGHQRLGLDGAGRVQYRDVNGDGRLDYQDAGYFGTGLPPWLLSLSEELRVGRATLQTQFDAQLGYQLLNPVLARLDHPSGDVNGSTRVLDRWTATHRDTDVPAASYYNQPIRYDNLATQTASHLRLAQLTLGYQLRPASGRLPVQVWVGGQNLWVLTSYRGFDPNVSSGGSLGQQAGYDASTYPVARVWQLGVRATL